jgi:hypothetical protein
LVTDPVAPPAGWWMSGKPANESTPRSSSQDSQGFWCSGNFWRAVKPGSIPS